MNPTAGWVSPPHQTPLAPVPALTDTERRPLEALRERYQQSGDTLSERELARLRFLRWLYLSGRLVP